MLGLCTPDGIRGLAAVDGSHLSTEVAGGFTGRVIAVQVHDSSALLERFTYRTEA